MVVDKSENHPDPVLNCIFDENKPLNIQKVGFFFGNNILGASYFRKKETAIKYISAIKDVCKYVEDNTSTAFAIADNVRIYHLKNMLYGMNLEQVYQQIKVLNWKVLMKKEFLRKTFNKFKRMLFS